MCRNWASPLSVATANYTIEVACGKRNKAENLMKGLVVDIQHLACEQGIRMATKAQREQPSRAIRQASDLLPSVSEHLKQRPGVIYFSKRGTTVLLR